MARIYVSIGQLVSSWWSWGHEGHREGGIGYFAGSFVVLVSLSAVASVSKGLGSPARAWLQRFRAQYLILRLHDEEFVVLDHWLDDVNIEQLSQQIVQYLYRYLLRLSWILLFVRLVGFPDFVCPDPRESSRKYIVGVGVDFVSQILEHLSQFILIIEATIEGVAIAGLLHVVLLSQVLELSLEEWLA